MEFSGTVPLRRVGAVAVLILGLAATAAADLDVSISNNTIVAAQLGPADEVETYRFTAAAGSKVAVTLKAKPAKKETPPAFAVEIRDADGDVVATGAAKKSTVKVRGFSPSETGEYRIVVTGDGVNTGAYQLKAKWKPPTRSKVTLPAVDGEGRHGFAAAPGSKISVKVAAAKSSVALPRLGLVRSLDDAYQFDAFTAPKPTARSHSGKKIVLATLREYELVFQNTGAAGDVVVDVKLKAPKVGRSKVDLSDEALGGGEQIGASGGKPVTAFGGVIGPEGGSLFVDDMIGGLLAGTGIEVPPGAMTQPVAITFGEAINGLPAPDDVLEQIGPTVFFGPEGLTFSEPALVTIPFDADAYGGSLDDIEIYARDEDGVVALIPQPYEFDLVTGTCTFPVNHFTSFRAFAPPQRVFVENEIAFVPGDAVNRDKVGTSVAIDGSVLVIGAPEHDLQSGGEGAAYVYTMDAKGWAFAQKLTASDAGSSDGFGTSVAVEGNTIVVGAPLASVRTTRPGAAYVYQFFQTAWFETDKLIGSQTTNGDGCGRAVAIANGIILVGVPGETQLQTLQNAGAVYAFEALDGYIETQRMTQSNTGPAQRFGEALAAEKDRLVVGAPGTLVAGRAFVFDRGANGWAETAELFHDGAVGEADFGHAVALDGDRAVVTDPLFDDPAGGGLNAGRAFVFDFSTVWGLQRVIPAPVIEGGSRFGSAAGVIGDFVVIGHRGLDLPPTGAGAIHVFERQDGTWPVVVTRGADVPALLQDFGTAIATDGTVILVGEPGNTGTTGGAYLYDLVVRQSAGQR